MSSVNTVSNNREIKITNGELWELTEWSLIHFPDLKVDSLCLSDALYKKVNMNVYYWEPIMMRMMKGFIKGVHKDKHDRTEMKFPFAYRGIGDRLGRTEVEAVASVEWMDDKKTIEARCITFK